MMMMMMMMMMMTMMMMMMMMIMTMVSTAHNDLLCSQRTWSDLSSFTFLFSDLDASAAPRSCAQSLLHPCLILETDVT
ncbi:hypothetical protein ElyMa_001667800 [Elysia marginata]|uniref:Secreted protein n=1 Tax=Elysia marginata TaxID=1093978 RepID=A0AAV4JSY8_9GAST|nr:hypothetical protein ElyMa_001667800 [Elysia marginata]